MKQMLEMFIDTKYAIKIHKAFSYCGIINKWIAEDRKNREFELLLLQKW